MSKTTTTIDSHVHLDLIVRYHPDRIQWLIERSCGVVSWSYFENVQSASHLKACLAAKAQCVQDQFAYGLNCHFLCGVHPRSIPADLKPENIEDLLTPYFQNPLCLGIGEIGLETGSTQEKEVLLAQLELGRQLTSQGAVVGVHTPRSNKAAITQATLGLLDGFSDLAGRLVVDHCSLDTIPAVLDAGFWAGVTLSPIKTSWGGLKKMVNAESPRVERIMVNTDSGSDFYEDLVHCAGRADLSDDLRRQLFHDTAARFFAFRDRAA